MNRTSTLTLAFLYCFLVPTITTVGQEYPPESFNTDGAGVAIYGYDPVAYFTMNAAVPGNPEIRADYEGILFYFASQEHRELFEADPQAFLPQYGGWCAWAASRNSLADIDPEQFVVQDGRLFLNYSGFINLRFRSRLDYNIEQADENWPELSRQAADR
jgi:YHS domain-containing protein